MEGILSRLLVPDNDTIKAATAELRTAFKHPGVIPELCSILTTSTSVQIRQYAEKEVFEIKRLVRTQPCRPSNPQVSLVTEPERTVRNALAQLVSVLAKHELSPGQSGWPELLMMVQEKLSSQDSQHRVLAVYTLSVLAENAGEQIRGNLKEFLKMFGKSLKDPELEVCFYTITALTHLVRRTSSEEVIMFQQIIPAVLQKIEMLASKDQDKATMAIDIFDELIESEVAIVVPHIKPMVELCLKLAAEPELDDALRIKAVTFLGRLTRLKKKTIVKHKLYIPMINIVFSVMCQQELPDVEDDDNDKEDDDSPALAASQCLDILALNLPPEKFMTALLAQVQPALENSNPAYQRAAYQAIAVSAEGCQEHIRSKYLQSFLQCIGQGIKNNNPLVRNAALYTLGQFSEFIQPEISNYAPEILPILLEHLDLSFASIQPGGKDPPGVARVFYALETFCENLDDKLEPHLPAIMQRAIATLNDQFSVRVRELSISMIAAAANASQAALVPYLDQVMPVLEQYLSMTHSDDTQVLLTQSMCTLSVLARAVGQEKFSGEFCEKCIKIGMTLIETNDDPDVRKCAYNLFGAVATVVKEKMAPILEPCVTLMLKTVQSTEGVSLELEGNDSNLPLEELSDDEEDISGEDVNATALEELEGIKSVQVENAFLAEKEQAILALKEFSANCGAAFYPYLYQSLEETSQLMDYLEEDVRRAAIDATAHFLIAYYKSGNPEGVAAFNTGLSGFLPRLTKMVLEEEDHGIVLSALEAITELLKECKQGVTAVAGNPEAIVNCVSKIMKSECAVQDTDDDESLEGEEAEQDEMLFEYAGEVLPNLGRAMTPDAFSPYFAGLLPLLLKKTKKHCTVAERSFGVGSVADCMEPLAGNITPFMKHLMPTFFELMKDAEDDVRNNAVFGLGELVLWAGPDAKSYYTQILARLSELLSHESSPRVVDQVTGAVCRFVVADLASVPVDDIVPAVLKNLPLKEDEDEYEMVFKCFTTLYSAGHHSVKSSIPKIIECAAAFYASKATDKEKVSPIVENLVKLIARDFPEDMTAVVQTLPAESSCSIMKIVSG